jgi:tetratricopeptide (TPR) repeat protein
MSVLFEELYEAYPNNVSFKNGLAISYSKLGHTHAELGNFDQTLTFNEKANETIKELYEAYPNNVEFKNGLAVSYSKLSHTNAAQGNLDQALDFHKKDIELTKELYEAYPNNVEFKNNLAEALRDLGMFSRDNLKDRNKAKTYFQEAEILWLELVRDAPQFVDFQKFLGMIRDEISNLDK